MNLYTTCNHCGEKHRVKKKYYSTRVSFKMHEGDTYCSNCKYCFKEIERSVNDIYATYSLYTFAILTFLSILATVYTYLKVINYTPEFTPTGYNRPWYTLLIFPPIIILFYRSSERSRIRTFNRVKT